MASCFDPYPMTEVTETYTDLQTYRWHDHLTLEPSSDAIIDTLWLSPTGIDTHVGVTLMSVEALRA
jgi:hypothetical protein